MPERFDRWPLGLNPEMDEHAAKNGFPHWSCVSSCSNEWWVRRDGWSHHATFRLPGGYVAELRQEDDDYPMQKEKHGAWDRASGVLVVNDLVNVVHDLMRGTSGATRLAAEEAARKGVAWMAGPTKRTEGTV